MTSLVFQSVLETGQESLDFGIRDLLLVETDTGVSVMATTASGGGLVSYQLGDASGATLVDTQWFPEDVAEVADASLALIETATGPVVIVGGDGDTLAGYEVGSDGSLDSLVQTADLGCDTENITAVFEQDEHLFLADNQGNLTCFTSDGLGGYGEPEQIAMAPGSGTVTNLSVATVDGNDFLIATCSGSNTVMSFRLGDGDAAPVLQGSMGAADGLGIMTPTALEVITVLDVTYVVVASAASGNGSGAGALTVMELTSDGDLVPTDHVLDTQYTRFGGVQSLEAVEVDGRTYLIAGGGDDGLSLFTVMPGGQLVHLDSITNETGMGLENITDLAAAHVGDDIQIMAASQSGSGLSQLSVSVANQGEMYHAAQAGDTIQSGSGDDILTGNDGDDLLKAGNGADILADGAGADTLYGGNGADIFVLSGDTSTDQIMDFEVGVDQLDLSGFLMFYDPNSLTITSTSYGAQIEWRGDVTEIHSASGASITHNEIIASIREVPDRPPLGLASETTGTNGADVIIGDWQSESLIGLMGHDSIQGMVGDDTLRGGDGHDYLDGGAGDDLIYGGAGLDTIFGGDGNDTVYGDDGRDMVYFGAGDDVFYDTSQGGDLGRDTVYAGDGNDSVYGGNGDDVYHGLNGDDLIFGSLGNDQVYGGTGFDTLYGNEGNDTIWAGDGRDLVYLGDGADVFHDTAQGGTSGRDTVYGGQGNDRIEGGNGDDEFHGQDGDDVINGRLGNDLIYGGVGFDTIYGGEGSDTVYAGDGRDLVYLGSGADVFHDTTQGGELGRDTVYAGMGNDTIEGGNGNDEFHGLEDDDLIYGRFGNDLIYGGTGFDTIYGDQGHDTVHGGDGRDVVYLGSGNDVFFDTTQGGDLGNDQVFGGNGQDTIHASGGNDTLTGGKGADVFVFHENGAEDWITDFTLGEDQLWFDMDGTISSLDVYATAGGTMIEYGSGQVFLEGISPSEISSEDVLFV